MAEAQTAFDKPLISIPASETGISNNAEMDRPSPPKSLIGIDFGTSFIRMGIFRNGKFEVILNDNGQPFTPNYLAFTKDRVLFGDLAKGQATSNPIMTINGVNRFLGRTVENKHAKDMSISERKNWPFRIISHENNLVYVIENEDGFGEIYYPEKLTAMFLAKLKNYAEEYLKFPISSAVISIPAACTTKCRQAMGDAAQAAGFSVMNLIEGTTAAALAFQNLGKLPENENVLIFDMGGSSIEISVVQRIGNVIDLKYSARFPFGGEDVDISSMRRLMPGESLVDKGNFVRLKISCEDAKVKLNTSSGNDSGILIDTTNGSNTYLRIEDVQNIVSSHRQSIEYFLRKALKLAQVDKSKIKTILLSGGSSQLDCIKYLLTSFFGSHAVILQLNSPAETIVEGAAIQAAMIREPGAFQNFSIIKHISSTLSIGLAAVDKKHPLIIEGSKLPILCNSTTYFAAEDLPSSFTAQTTAIFIKVIESNSLRPEEHAIVGDFEVEVNSMVNGDTSVGIQMSVDESGVITTNLLIPAIGLTEKFVIGKNGLSKRKLDRMTAEVEIFMDKEKERAITSSAPGYPESSNDEYHV